MQEKLKSFNSIKDILPFLWVREEKVRSLFLISFGLIIVSIFLNLSIPLVLKEVVVILSTSSGNMPYQLTLLLIAYGAIWTLSQTIQQVRQIVMLSPLEKSVRLFCFHLFNHLHSLPMEFHLSKKTGAITSALERAQNAFPNIFWGLFLFVIPTTIEILLAAIILYYYYGFIYGFILITIAAIFIIFTYYATDWAAHFQYLSNEQESETNANIIDSLLNFANVKYFNNKSHEVTKCEIYLRKREKFLVKSLSSMEFIRVGQSLIIGSGLIWLTYTAGRQASLNLNTVSDFILINGYVLQFAAPLAFMGFIARDIRKGLNDFTSIMEIYHIKPFPSYSGRGVTIPDKIDKIEFKNVSFGYEPSCLVLKNVSFEVSPGKMIAIVGPTGSGKSTLTNLLFRFYNTTNGNIFINNNDIKNIHIENLYDKLGIVPQDVTLFNTSVYENILYARPDARKEEVEEVIKLAHLQPALQKLPYHYNTIVG